MAGADDRPAGVPPVQRQPPAGPVDEQRRRRRRAEAAAEAAEAQAAEAAARASAAIAAASRAATDAEAAAEAAALAAAEVEAAVAAERAALVNGAAPERTRDTDAVTEALPVAAPVAAPGPDDDDTPALGARAARRRAQEAAAAVAREATRDPDTEVIGPDESRGRLGRLLGATRAQLDTRALLTASAVGTVLVVAGVLAAVFGGARAPVAAPVPPPAAAVPAVPTVTGPSGPAVTTAAPAPTEEARSDAPVDPTTPKALAYLAALRAAGVPTSDSGESETEAAAVICQQLAKGTAAADLVTALPTVLPTVNGRQAKSMVAVAQKTYC